MEGDEEEVECFFAERWERWKQEKRELNELLGDARAPMLTRPFVFSKRGVKVTFLSWVGSRTAMTSRVLVDSPRSADSQPEWKRAGRFRKGAPHGRRSC